MGDIDEIDGERTDRQMSANRNDLHRNFRRAGLGSAPRLEQSRGKRRGMDRHFEPRPQIDQCPHMVLVAMREHQRENVATFFDQKSDVREDEIDAGELLF